MGPLSHVAFISSVHFINLYSHNSNSFYSLWCLNLGTVIQVPNSALDHRLDGEILWSKDLGNRVRHANYYSFSSKCKFYLKMHIIYTILVLFFFFSFFVRLGNMWAIKVWWHKFLILMSATYMFWSFPIYFFSKSQKRVQYLLHSLFSLCSFAPVKTCGK